MKERRQLPGGVVSSLSPHTTGRARCAQLECARVSHAHLLAMAVENLGCMSMGAVAIPD